jgi:hypothetical protein
MYPHEKNRDLHEMLRLCRKFMLIGIFYLGNRKVKALKILVCTFVVKFSNS